MKIGVISDTHLKAPNPFIEEVIETYFKSVDLILHGGDFFSLELLDAFRGKKIIAVAGNCDSTEVKQRFSQKEVVTINQFRIGLIHGWGWPMGIEKKLDTSNPLVYVTTSNKNRNLRVMKSIPHKGFSGTVGIMIYLLLFFWCSG